MKYEIYTIRINSVGIQIRIFYVRSYIRTSSKERALCCRHRGFERVRSQRDLTPCDCRRNRRYRVIVFASSLSKDHRMEHSTLSPLATQALGFQPSCSRGASSHEARCDYFPLRNCYRFFWFPSLAPYPPPFFGGLVFLECLYFFFRAEIFFPPSLFCFLGFEALPPTSISVSCVFFCFKVCSL